MNRAIAQAQRAAPIKYELSLCMTLESLQDIASDIRTSLMWMRAARRAAVMQRSRELYWRGHRGMVQL